jgi:hypothetical protein
MSSRRVIFQNFILEHGSEHAKNRSKDETNNHVGNTLGHELVQMQNEDLHDELEEKEEEPPADHMDIIRRSAKKQLTVEQRVQRRRKLAHGSIWWRYLYVRLQLRVLIRSSRNVVIFFLGSFALIGIWAFLVFGKPDSPAHWQDLDTRWGGRLSENDTVICETPKPLAFTKQPASAFATVTYGIAGWFMLWLYILDEKNNLTFEARFGNVPASLVVRRCYWSALLGMSLLTLSTLSWLRHATVSNVGKRLETTGYWTVLFAYSMCSVCRLVDPPRKLRSREWAVLSKIITFIFIFATVAVDVAFGIRIEALRQPGVPEIVFGVLAGLSLLSVLVHWRMHRLSIETEIWLLFIGLFTFIGGFLFARFDLEICRNNYLFLQPYAFWHVSNSMAAVYFYLFLRADLWVKGDGAEFAPRIRPLIWMKTGILALIDSIKEICKGARYNQSSKNPEKKKSRITLLRRSKVQEENLSENEEDRPEGEDEVNPQRPQSRYTTTLRSVKSVATMWTPEIGFTAKQIRIAEAFCGLIITGFIVYIIYLALSQPK